MSFDACVDDVRLRAREGTRERWEMALDRTAFEPGDTGTLEAVTRQGTRLIITVEAVERDADGVTWHAVEKPLAAGTDVVGSPRPRTAL